MKFQLRSAAFLAVAVVGGWMNQPVARGQSPATDAQALDAQTPGLVGKYYQLKNPTDFPGELPGEPYFVRVDKQINFPDASGEFNHSKLSVDFMAVWTGTLHAPAAGEYTFTTAVDDAVRVTIDGKRVIEDVTKNGMARKSATVELTAGNHPIVVEFLQKQGGSGVVLSWKPPGGREAPIGAEAFSHEKSSEQVKWDRKRWEHQGGNLPITEWDNLDYGPFLSATIVINAVTPNFTYKGVAVKLGAVAAGAEKIDASMCFDTQLCRVSAGWTGRFLSLNNVAFTGEHGPAPAVAGDVKFSTPGNQVVWANKDGKFVDPRIAMFGEAFGGMPRDYLHYKGLYRHGEQVAFSYSVNGMDVLESPGAKAAGSDVAFTRTFKIGPSKAPQSVILASVDGGVFGQEAGKHAAYLDAEGMITAAGIIQPQAGAAFSSAENEGHTAHELVLTIPAHTGEQTFELVMWTGDKTNFPTFEASLGGEVADISAITKGGPSHWPKEIETVGKLKAEPAHDADKADYVLDEITVPAIPKEWPRLRFGGLDFFPDGKSAALCTWNGDVYVVKGIDEKLDHLTWRRVAGGLFQTLGLKIVDGNIYVHGRDQVTILKDLDGDGEADFYECFNNDVAMTDHFHEFAFDLQRDAAGNFYIIKGGGVNPGGRGFQEPITRNHGTLMKISPDGSKMEVVATGFRAPNGMCVRDDGQVITGDNQGSWTPVDRLNWVKPGMFCGVATLSHRTPEPTVTDNPLMWFPYPGWDNSCGDPVFVTSDKWGQPKGDLFYLSYGQTSLLHILPEKKDGEMQGGAVRWPWHFASGAMRARFNPGDGQLYVCGFQGWQTNAHAQTNFERVRYTGKKSYQPTALHVKDNGVELTFAEPLKKDSVEDVGAWSVEQWNYRWTSDYGSPEVKVSSPGQNGHDPVEIKSVKLSEDGKKVFIELPAIQPVMQMAIRANALEAADGSNVNVEMVNTINAVKGKKLVVGVGTATAK